MNLLIRTLVRTASRKTKKKNSKNVKEVVKGSLCCSTYVALYILPLQFWHHEFLVWDPDECDGVTRISLPVKRLWSPDIIVYEL